MEKQYKAGYGSDKKPYVDGPSDGSLSYHGGTLWPDMRCDSEAESERAAAIANIAFAEGYKAAQHDIRRALGIGA